jgi:hypothetical protein
MAYLYKNQQGHEVNVHSFSSGSDFRKCPRLYQLKRILGWREKEDRAAMRFGNALESAIQKYHETQLSPEEEFKRIWDKVRQVESVNYGESSWEEMLIQGADMCRLYVAKCSTFPIDRPKFQLNYRKEVYPNTYLGGIIFTAYLDILSQLPESGKLIIDVKSSGRDLQSPLLALDPQLRRYAWLTGIENVAFMWFTRVTPEIKRGHKVYVFERHGDPLIVFVAGIPNESNPVLISEKDYEEYEKSSQGLKGKALDGIKESFAETRGIVIPHSGFTKQRLTFFQGKISKEEQDDSGEAIGREIAEIVAAREAGKYPQHCGIRFPDDNCLHCPMRGICGHDDKLRDELLIAPSAQQDPDWVKEFLED